MAPPARKISKQEWERHADIIHNLYHVRKLPLHSEKGDPNVVQIMRDEYQFSASLSQYEAYFKKSEQPKNLKREEWRAVHIKLNELSALNIEARVKLSGQVLSKARIERTRRYAFSGLEKSRHKASDGLALPPTCRVTIETRGADGEWSAYDASNVANNFAHPPLPADDYIILESEENSALIPTFEVTAPYGSRAITNILSIEAPPLFGIPSSPWNDSIFLSELSRLPEIDHPWYFGPGALQLSGTSPVSSNFPRLSTYENPLTPPNRAGELLFFQLREAVLAKPRQEINSQHKSLEHAGASFKGNSSPSDEAQISPEALVKSLLEDATQVLIGNSMSNDVSKLPNPDDVMDSLLSLLPESPAQDGSGQTTELATKDVIFDSPFYSALIFSIANGFAGLRNIPSGAILRMLRKQHQMSSRLFDCLRLCPPALAKPLADNLFRAAVEACDEEAVIIILQATRNSPNAIDPNEIVCKLHENERLYTPIELAAKFRHLGIVQTLLAANADVNKTHEEDIEEERGALELAVRKWGEYETVDMKLVRTLLDCHAEVRVALASAVIRWGQTDLLQELISRLPASVHRTCFQSSMLSDSAQYLGNNLATYIIKQIFKNCQAENCLRCPSDHGRLMRGTLCFAARRGNFELVQFLLPYTTCKNAALSAAVKSGSYELIDLLLQHGASVGGLTSYQFVHYPDLRYNYQVSLHPSDTTPLAEAIRSQNKEFVQKFESLGALSQMNMNQENYLEATVFAAVEVNDCCYVQKLLELGPKKRRTNLGLAVALAIRNDKTEAALILLSAGANINAIGSSPSGGSPLLDALQKHNKTVVMRILEADVDINLEKYYSFRETSLMEAAALWGDIRIVEDLIFMGADIDAGLKTTALAAAVKSRNRVLVELLLKNGASPSQCAESGVIPLGEAVANEDNDMIQLLLASGADPANDHAFLSAIENGGQAFRTLLDTFCAKYPQGKKNFGGNLLIKAIKKEDATLLKTILAAKFDPNSYLEQNNNTLLTALGFAISYQKGGHLELVQKLIDAGGDPNSLVQRSYNFVQRPYNLTRYGDEIVLRETALLVAIKTRSEQLVELLLANGADLHRPARLGLKRTPLQQACEIGSFKIVTLLLERGATVNEQPADRGGATALQLAVISGSIKIADFLLTRGASVHASGAKVEGRTAFEGAAEHGCLEMIKVLWDAVSGQGFTPKQIENAISLAKSRGHRGCAEYIAALSSRTSFLSLQADSFINFEME